MLSTLKRILSKVEEWITAFADRHTQNLIWNTTALLAASTADESGYIATGTYDELTILHKADQSGTLKVLEKCPIGKVYTVDTVAYGADETVSRVYSITGTQINVQITNGTVAQTDRGTYATLRKT